MNKNIFVYLTSFFCGMSIMAVELSATRLLAPYFGTSMIVWTIVIGLIMISLSLGNIIGGRLADKHNNADKLYFLIWLVSICIAIIPLVGKYVITFSVIIFMWLLPNNLLVSGSIFSCLLIFSLPLVILGMVSPYLVKLGVKDIQNNGKTTGEIYALSTIGSIIGTFIPTFIIIPFIGTNKTFYIFALILNLICLIYFIKAKTKIFRTAITALIITVLTFSPTNNSYAFWKSSAYEGESLYNYLQVSEDNNSVILSTNVAFGVQSLYKKDKSLSGYYYDYALMAPLFIKNMDFNKKLNSLILGLGTGTFAKQSKRFFTNIKTDGVEIDQKIVELSQKYFELTSDEANIFVNDGRTFLSSESGKKYDMIMIDAYHDITIPFHMCTQEFFAQVKEHLNKNGVIVMNINMRSKKNTEITDYLTQTLKYNMKKVLKFDIQNGTNTLVISSDDENCLANYRENIKNFSETHPLFDISQYIDRHINEVTDSKYVLTDDKAPVEIMGQKVLNEIVGESIAEFKHELLGSENGIKDLFNIISGN